MKHPLAVCAIVKNECDYLLEWIAYHRVVGADHFLIYNNSGEDDDGTTNLLRQLHGTSGIEVVQWPDRSSWPLPHETYLRPQIPAYWDGLERLRNKAEWVAFIDADEFLLPMKGNSLPETLQLYRNFGGVAVNWRMFGFSGEDKKRNLPVCRRFTRAASAASIVNQHVKCIVRPELIREVGIHRPFLNGGILVDEHGRELKHPYGFRYPVSYDILRINHYYTKSREEWLAKVERGRASHPRKRNESSITHKHFSDEQDECILRFCEATLRGMHRLAESAGIVNYPSLVEGERETASSYAARLGEKKESGALQFDKREDSQTKRDPTSDRVRASGPVLDVHLIGGYANRMMQYLVALRIAAGVDGCQISNAILPDWGIEHALLPGALGSEIIPSRSRQQLDIPAITKNLSGCGRGTFQSAVQWLSNFPDLDFSRNVFPPDESVYPGFGSEYLVCNVRGGEILDGSQPHRVLLPVEFYAELAQTLGLKLVFMGQIDKNVYCGALRSRFNDAVFLPSRGALADFQTLRNSKNLVLSVSAFSWLAGWLSTADRIVLPISGMFHPLQEAHIDLLPVEDERYSFYLFPINFAVPVARFAQAHRALVGNWRLGTREIIRGLRTPRQPRRLEPFVSCFDEGYYLRTYTDIASAVSAGNLQNGREHYVNCGFREGRNAFAFDQFWYSMTYPAAAIEVGHGEFADLRHHYVEVGAQRGYKPVPDAN